MGEPVCLIPAAALSSLEVSRPVMVTAAPRAPRRLAMSSPIPVEPPTMSAVFILLLRIFILVLLVVSVQRLVAPSPENAVCGNMFVAGLAARR
jgi:hypothetical protein